MAKPYTLNITGFSSAPDRQVPLAVPPPVMFTSETKLARPKRAKLKRANRQDVLALRRGVNADPIQS